MSERGAYVPLGLLIIAGIALSLGMIWFLGGQRIRQGQQVESYFSESVQGLDVGAPVKYRGVTLGRVIDIGLVSAEYPDARMATARTYRLVFVRYVIDEAKTGRAMDPARAVKLGLRVRLAAQGITGLTYLELDFVDPEIYPATEVPWQPKAAYIPSMPSTMFQVQNTAQEVLAKLNRADIDGVTRAIIALVHDLQQQFSEGDAHQALVQMTALEKTLQKAVRDADLPGLTAELRHTSEAIRDVAQGQALQHTLASTDRAATALAQAATRMSPLIVQLQKTTHSVGDSAADLQQALVPLLRDLQATAQNLRETSEMLRRYPGQILSGPPPRTPEHAR